MFPVHFLWDSIMLVYSIYTTYLRLPRPVIEKSTPVKLKQIVSTPVTLDIVEQGCLSQRTHEPWGAKFASSPKIISTFFKHWNLLK